MTRTTIDLDDGVLRDLKRRGRRDGKPLGVVASELLAAAMRPGSDAEPQPLAWTVAALGQRVDIDDKDALWAALDGS